MQIAARLARIGEDFNDAIVESANEASMWKARVAEFEARAATQDSQPARNNKQSDAEHKLRLVRRVMLGLLDELGVLLHARLTFSCSDVCLPSQVMGHHQVLGRRDLHVSIKGILALLAVRTNRSIHPRGS